MRENRIQYAAQTPLEAFNDSSDGVFYQCRLLAYICLIDPTESDLIIAHSLGVQLERW